MERKPKPVKWVGSSLRDLRAFPPEVRKEVGYAIYAAQMGETDPAAKPMKGFHGAGVMEIVAPFDGDTWRGVYAVRLKQVAVKMPSSVILSEAKNLSSIQI